LGNPLSPPTIDGRFVFGLILGSLDPWILELLGHWILEYLDNHPLPPLPRQQGHWALRAAQASWLHSAGIPAWPACGIPGNGIHGNGIHGNGIHGNGIPGSGIPG
jgi:hypothetical protein